jgi:hypothetical protein
VRTFLRKGAALVLVGLGALAAAGCGWRAGMPLPNGARTLAIGFAQNDARLPALEVDLTDALHRAALDRLDLAIATGAADLRLSARIVDLRRRGGVRSEEARLLEAGVTFVIEVDLVDGASGAVLRSTRRRLTAGYVVGTAESPATAPEEPLARERLLDNLADGVVLDLFAPLSYNRSAEEGVAPP